MTQKLPAPADDAERLEELLSHRLGNRIRGLRLVFEQLGVILRGRSENFHARQSAQHAVMEVAARPISTNEIEVQ